MTHCVTRGWSTFKRTSAQRTWEMPLDAQFTSSLDDPAEAG